MWLNFEKVATHCISTSLINVISTHSKVLCWIYNASLENVVFLDNFIGSQVLDSKTVFIHGWACSKTFEHKWIIQLCQAFHKQVLHFPHAKYIQWITCIVLNLRSSRGSFSRHGKLGSFSKWRLSLEYILECIRLSFFLEYILSFYWDMRIAMIVDIYGKVGSCFVCTILRRGSCTMSIRGR